VLLWNVASAGTQQLGTAEQAKAMLDRAVSALKSNESTALSEFNDPNNKQYHDRDLYVFCFNLSDGKITAYESPALLNIDVRTLALKDDQIGQRAFEAVQNSAEGSVVTIDYNFPKPGTTEPVPSKLLRRASATKAAASRITNRLPTNSRANPFLIPRVHATFFLLRVSFHQNHRVPFRAIIF